MNSTQAGGSPGLLDSLEDLPVSVFLRIWAQLPEESHHSLLCTSCQARNLVLQRVPALTLCLEDIHDISPTDTDVVMTRDARLLATVRQLQLKGHRLGQPLRCIHWLSIMLGVLLTVLFFPFSILLLVWLTVYAMRSMAVRLQAGGEQEQPAADLDLGPHPLVAAPAAAAVGEPPLAAGAPAAAAGGGGPLEEVQVQAGPHEDQAAAGPGLPQANEGAAAAAGHAANVGGALQLLAPQAGGGDGAQVAGEQADFSRPSYAHEPGRGRRRGTRRMAHAHVSGTREQRMMALAATLAPAATRLEPLRLTVRLVGRKASHLGILLDLPGCGVVVPQLLSQGAAPYLQGQPGLQSGPCSFADGSGVELTQQGSFRDRGSTGILVWPSVTELHIKTRGMLNAIPPSTAARLGPCFPSLKHITLDGVCVYEPSLLGSLVATCTALTSLALTHLSVDAHTPLHQGGDALTSAATTPLAPLSAASTHSAPVSARSLPGADTQPQQQQQQQRRQSQKKELRLMMWSRFSSASGRLSRRDTCGSGCEGDGPDVERGIGPPPPTPRRRSSASGTGLDPGLLSDALYWSARREEAEVEEHAARQLAHLPGLTRLALTDARGMLQAVAAAAPGLAGRLSALSYTPPSSMPGMVAALRTITTTYTSLRTLELSASRGQGRTAPPPVDIGALAAALPCLTTLAVHSATLSHDLSCISLPAPSCSAPLPAPSCSVLDIPPSLMLASSSISSSSNYSVSALSLATTSVAAGLSVQGSGAAEIAAHLASGQDYHHHYHPNLQHHSACRPGSMDHQANSSAGPSTEAKLTQLAALMRLRRLVIESGTLSFLTASRLPPQLAWVDGLEVRQLGDSQSFTTRRGGSTRTSRYRPLGGPDTSRPPHECEPLTPELLSKACTRVAPLVKGREKGGAAVTVCFPPTSLTGPYGHLAELCCSLAPLAPLQSLTLTLVSLDVAEVEALASVLGSLQVLGLQQARQGAPLLEDTSAPGSGYVAAALTRSFPGLTALELGYGCGLPEDGRQVPQEVVELVVGCVRPLEVRVSPRRALVITRREVAHAARERGIDLQLQHGATLTAPSPPVDPSPVSWMD